jgi:translation initiation factor eIF-2B subunit delta
MDPEVFAGVRAIKEDREHGAAHLAAEAMRALALAATRSAATTVLEFMEEMEVLVKDLAVIRPSMTPLATAGHRWLRELRQLAPPTPTVEELRQVAIALAQQLRQQMEEARHQAAAGAARLVEQSSRVLTCSYSATVAEAITRAGRKALSQGRAFIVLIAYSAEHGKRLAALLQREDVPSRILCLAEIEAGAKTADLALVGADTVLPDGSVVNGEPTLALARAAARAQIPFYVVADSFKWAEREVPLEEGFERIPAELVSVIITEAGPVQRANWEAGGGDQRC